MDEPDRAAEHHEQQAHRSSRDRAARIVDRAVSELALPELRSTWARWSGALQEIWPAILGSIPSERHSAQQTSR